MLKSGVRLRDIKSSGFCHLLIYPEFTVLLIELTGLSFDQWIVITMLELIFPDNVSLRFISFKFGYIPFLLGITIMVLL